MNAFARAATAIAADANLGTAVIFQPTGCRPRHLPRRLLPPGG
jgi:hypothetical protein